jgi:hypothetical protein
MERATRTDSVSLRGGELNVASPRADSAREVRVFTDPSLKEFHKGGVEGGCRFKVFVRYNESPPWISMIELSRDGCEDGLG